MDEKAIFIKQGFIVSEVFGGIAEIYFTIQRHFIFPQLIMRSTQSIIKDL